jgi:hypothetical protein
MQPAGGARAPGPEKFPAGPGDPAGIKTATRTTVTSRPLPPEADPLGDQAVYLSAGSRAAEVAFALQFLR